MSKVRIEIHLTEEETKTLDKIASEHGRSRKNLCETEIRKLIKRGQSTFGNYSISIGNPPNTEL